jgi:hypothetical protein
MLIQIITIALGVALGLEIRDVLIAIGRRINRPW